MPYDTAGPIFPMPAPPGTAAGRRKNQRCRPVGSLIYWPLPILFAALQLADVVTTNYALAIPGVWEANPLMALLQAKLGAAWWLPKLAVAGFVCLMTPLLRRQWRIIVVVSYYAVAVSINLAHL